MAFFDKLNDLAKNIGDKTSDAIETSKLNSKINAERAAAGEELKKIGQFYYERYIETGEAVPEVLEYCQSAREHYEAAQAAQGEIDRIRAENEAAKAAAAAPAVPEAANGLTCPGCGGINAPGVKFCSQCGSKLEPPAPVQPEARLCPACGAQVAPDVKFCSQCGQKME